MPTRPPARACWRMTAIPRRIGRWGGRCGCAAARTRRSLELAQSVDLSPNFALGHYTLAFVNSQSGEPRERDPLSSDHSRHLSPFDPLLFAMLGGARLGAFSAWAEFDQAADWAVKAAARPNAHAHVLAIAAHCLAAADRLDEARAFAATIHRARPHMGSFA